MDLHGAFATLFDKIVVSLGSLGAANIVLVVHGTDVTCFDSVYDVQYFRVLQCSLQFRVLRYSGLLQRLA